MVASSSGGATFLSLELYLTLFVYFFPRNVRKRKNFKIGVRKLSVNIITLFLRIEQRSAVRGGICRRMNVIYI